MGRKLPGKVQEVSLPPQAHGPGRGHGPPLALMCISVLIWALKIGCPREEGVCIQTPLSQVTLSLVSCDWSIKMLIGNGWAKETWVELRFYRLGSERSTRGRRRKKQQPWVKVKRTWP